MWRKEFNKTERWGGTVIEKGKTGAEGMQSEGIMWMSSIKNPIQHIEIRNKCSRTGKPLSNIWLLVDSVVRNITVCIKVSQVFYICFRPSECQVIVLWSACTINDYFDNKYVEPRTKLESKSNISVSISETEMSKLWLLWAKSEWLLLIVVRGWCGTVVNRRVL